MQNPKDCDNNSENLNEEDKQCNEQQNKSSSINQQVPQFPAKKTPSYSLEGPQILRLLNQFRTAQGNNKRELECQLIRRLVHIKKNIETDWYMLNGTWAQRYTQYLYENSNTLPGPIDNTELLQSKQLVQNRDYYIVNETVWKFLLEEYSGGPEILHEKTPPSPVSNMSSTADRAKSADISMMSSVSQYQEKSSDIPIRGLKNELFFCYMHSILQCLMGVREINNFVLNIIPRYTIQLTYNLGYQELLLQLQKSDQEYIKINLLRNLVSKKFSPKHQHDAEEFFLFLMSNFDDEIAYLNKELEAKGQPKVENVISRYLKGQIVSEVVCKNCKNKSTINEEFLTLSLALTKVTTVSQALEEFLKDELIQDYKCDHCHKKKTAIKKTRISNLPRYLVLHLKRFKYFPKSNKITQHVKFSMESNFCNTEFKLIGVVIHSGSLEQGHYYSYAKRQHKWWLFNDQRVKLANKSDVAQQQAYILFYQQLL